MSSSFNSVEYRLPDSPNTVDGITYQDYSGLLMVKSGEDLNMRSDSGIADEEDIDSVSRMKRDDELWPNISNVLSSHNWDFTRAIHPSANKAISHLDLLQKSMLVWQTQDKIASSVSNVRKDTPASQSSTSSSSKASSKPSQSNNNLRIDGIGQTPEKSAPFLGPDDVINEVITLLARLEGDRHDTLQSLKVERERVSDLSSKIDALAIDRLFRISEAVQKEHESCANNISELKWFIKYRSRTETRTKEKVNTAQLLNSRLKEEIEHVKHHIPLVEEKLELEGEAMARISLAQQDTNNELDLTMSRCAKVKAKSLEAQEKAKLDRIMIKKDMDEVQALLTKVTTELYNAEKLHSDYTRNCIEHRETIRHHQADLPLQVQRNVTASEKRALQAGKVKELEEKLSLARNENDILSIKKEELLKELSDQQAAFAKEEAELKSLIMEKEDKLKILTRNKKELEFERDENKKKINKCDLMKAANDRNMSRMEKELEKTSKSMDDLSKELLTIAAEHQRVKEKMDQDYRRCQTEEESQRTTAELLKKSIKDEIHQKILFQARLEADKLDQEKLQTEIKDKHETFTQRVNEIAKAVNEARTKMNKLQSISDECSNKLEGLRTDLSVKEKETASLLSVSDSSIQDLTHARLLKKEELERHRQQLDQMNQRRATMAQEIDDMNAQSEIIGRSHRVYQEANERLQLDFDELELQLESAQRLRNELKKSFNEISERNKDTDTKHRALMMERNDLLTQRQAEFNASKLENERLASNYRALQNQYLEIKKDFLSKYNQRIKVENTIKDLKQLALLNQHVHSSMQEYYRYRNLYNSSELEFVETESQNNAIRTAELQQELDKAVVKVMEFFDLELSGKVSSDADPPRVETKLHENVHKPIQLKAA